MDRKKALNILKLSGYTVKEDIQLQYSREKNRIEQSISRTNSESVRNAYLKKIETLNEAHTYLINNFESNPKSSIKVPKFRLKPLHWILISVMIVLVLGISSYFLVRNHQINELVDDGIIIFNSAKIGSDSEKLLDAKKLFEKAEKMGSDKAKFYHGMVLYKLGEKQMGMVKMQRADKEGYKDSTINFKIYQSWNIHLQSK